MIKLIVPALFAVLAAPVAQASVPADLGASAAISAVTGGASDVIARRGRGADDPAGHVRRGRGADKAPEVTAPLMIEARRGRGADDPAGHVRRGRGADKSIDVTAPVLIEARRGRGRGADDAPVHG